MGLWSSCDGPLCDDGALVGVDHLDHTLAVHHISHAHVQPICRTVEYDAGRIIAVHKLNLLAYYDLAKAMGETASNQALMDMAVTAAAVRRIDTTDFAMPVTESDVRLLMQELDFDGLRAAGEGLRQLHAKTDDGTDAAKNSLGNPA